MESELQHNRYGDISRIGMDHHEEESSYTAAESEYQRKMITDIDSCRFMVTLYRSLELRIPITIRMYDVFEQLMVIGIIEDIDRKQGRFRVDGEWFMLGDIVEIEQS